MAEGRKQIRKVGKICCHLSTNTAYFGPRIAEIQPTQIVKQMTIVNFKRQYLAYLQSKIGLVWSHFKGNFVLFPNIPSKIRFMLINYRPHSQPQFVWNDFCEDYVPTDRKHTYYPSVITNDRLYEIKISDLPVIPYFPVNSYYEWANYRYYGLRSATAYILVFDLSNIETFQYIKSLRDQICESRNMSNVPILVVGNKQDLVISEEGVTSSSKPALTSNLDEKRRDIANLVKKHWKCGYLECSAKYNWKVVGVFKELINMIDNLASREQSPMLDNIQEALDRNKCVVI